MDNFDFLTYILTRTRSSKLVNVNTALTETINSIEIQPGASNFLINYETFSEYLSKLFKVNPTNNPALDFLLKDFIANINTLYLKFFANFNKDPNNLKVYFKEFNDEGLTHLNDLMTKLNYDENSIKLMRFS